MHRRPPSSNKTRRRGGMCPPEALALGRRADALALGHAVLVGNRAGVVEWATEAWTRLTGFPLEQTIDKPIAHFLEHIDLEFEVVEFVAQHFRDGRPVKIELPFETPDGRTIQVLLEVEPIRETMTGLCPDETAPNEITRFIAVAREIEAPIPEMSRETRPASDSAEPQPPEASHTGHPRNDPPIRAGSSERAGSPYTIAKDASRVDGATALAIAVARGLPDTTVSPIVEILGENDLPPIRVDRDRFDELLADLLEAATLGADVSETTFMTTDCGWLEPGRSHRSRMHPIPAREVPPAQHRRIFLEVHDTRPHLDRPAVQRIRAGQPGPDPRERAIAEAARVAAELGLTFHLDSTAGCGTQVLLVVPPHSIEPENFGRAVYTTEATEATEATNTTDIAGPVHV